MQCPYCSADTSSALPRCARCNRPLPEREQQPPADLRQDAGDIFDGSGGQGLSPPPRSRSLVIVAVALVGSIAGITLITLVLTSQLDDSGQSPAQQPIAVIPSSSAQPPTSDVSSIPSAEDSFPSALDSSPTPDDASTVVQEFYQDINDEDFTAAWELGGKNIAGTSYAKWVAGFDTTDNVEVETTNTGDPEQVSVVIRATQNDGSVKVFHGTYTVSGGEIINADIS